MAKTLPIQQVSFRGEKDVFLAEGGGGGKAPKWVNDENIERNAHEVFTNLTGMSNYFDRERSLPLLTEVILEEKATAKSHRPSIRKMFDVRTKRNVLGSATAGKLLVKIDSKSDYDTIKGRFANRQIGVKSTRIGLAAIKKIKKYEAEIDPTLEEGDTAKVQLVDYLNEELNHRSNLMLRDWCSAEGLDAEELHYASGLRLFSISNTTRDNLKTIATMDGVLSVRKMPTIEFEVAPDLEASTMDVMRPKENVSYPKVGIMDSGVSANNYLASWVSNEDNISGLLETDQAPRHGSMVASVINYGDMLEEKELTQTGPCMIQSCIVNSDRVTVSEKELVRYIRESIARHPDVNVWNLSQGSKIEVEDGRFSDFAVALDSFQKLYGVLICKSAGNVELGDARIRITHGADSLMSLVVGSIAHAKTTVRDAEVNHRSPFSRVGPGVEFTVKPDLVHYGGNIDTHMKMLSEMGRSISLCSGTSFSTPRVASLAANLAFELGGNFDPLLIRTLLIHHADYPEEVTTATENLKKEMGYGLPAGLVEMTKNDADECTMVFQHTLDKGRDVVSLDFPYPESLVDDEGYFYGDIRVTMVLDPVLDASQGNEYCQSQASVFLETYDHVEHVRMEGTIRNEARTSSDAVNVLNASLYRAASKNLERASERVLIENAGKFSPVKKYHVDLSSMTPKNKEKALTSGRKWALKLEGLYREAAEQSRERDGIDISQRLVLAVTITDPQHKGVVYSECMQQLNARGYIHSSILTRAHVQIDND